MLRLAYLPFFLEGRGIQCLPSLDHYIQFLNVFLGASYIVKTKRAGICRKLTINRIPKIGCAPAHKLVAVKKMFTIYIPAVSIAGFYCSKSGSMPCGATNALPSGIPHSLCIHTYCQLSSKLLVLFFHQKGVVSCPEYQMLKLPYDKVDIRLQHYLTRCRHPFVCDERQDLLFLYISPFCTSQSFSASLQLTLGLLKYPK
jgi:hypothetical protein